MKLERWAGAKSCRTPCGHVEDLVFILKAMGSHLSALVEGESGKVIRFMF